MGREGEKGRKVGWERKKRKGELEKGNRGTEKKKEEGMGREEFCAVVIFP